MASTAPATAIAFPVIGEWVWILAVVAMASCANTILVSLMTGSRLMYGMSEEHSLPKFLYQVNSRFRTPHYSIAIAGLVSLLFLTLADIEVIVNISNFGALFAFLLVNLSVIVLRKNKPLEKRVFRIPLNIKNIPLSSVLGALACLLLLSQLELKVIAISLLTLAGGGIVYLIYVHQRRKPHFSRR